MGLRVPTTEETLESARDSGIPMCFEVKGAGPEEANRIAQWLVDLFVRHDALGWAVMAGYDYGALARAKARVPELILAPDRLPDNIAADPPEALRQARHLGAPVIMSHYPFLTAELVNHLHDGGSPSGRGPLRKSRVSSTASRWGPTGSSATTYGR